MIDLPIGENFENFVRWLKSTFSAVFDLFSGILDFSISLLEDVLLLNYKVPAASVIFILLLALLVGTLAFRYFRWKGLVAGMALTAVIVGSLEIWRSGQLDRRLTPELAATLSVHFSNLARNVESKAPEDFSGAIGVLDRIESELPGYDLTPAQSGSLRSQIDRSRGRIEAGRAEDYENVADELLLVQGSLGNLDLDRADAMMDALQRQVDRFNALVLIEESDRMVSDFQDAQNRATPRPLNSALNLRSYRNFNALLVDSREYFETTGSPETIELMDRAKESLELLNPRRLAWYPFVATGALLLLAAYLIAGSGIVIFSAVGFFLIVTMDLWEPTVESLALVISATLFALLLGVPIGVLAAGSKGIDRSIRPVLDLMQTMPAFVYLIPAVIFFGLGKVPGAMATLIFAMPPAVRLTTLGIRQVPAEVVEAAESFGCTRWQTLVKAQLPIALQTILAGVNQTIMLALSMVVIGGMIGAGGLGEVVLSGITQLKLGLGFEGGLAVVILAIYLDRVTQALGSPAKS